MSKHHKHKIDAPETNQKFPFEDMLKNVNVGEILKNVDIKQLASVVSNLKSKKETREVEEEKDIEQKSKKEKIIELLDDDEFKDAVLSLISKFRNANQYGEDISIFENSELRSSVYTVLEKILFI
ncbi:MAG: hypothetical protein Q8900_06235 [Bacillota bacterium]|nr:hypothetical protein [Bacillota bacterium]